jgi:uncharacterized YccA/Bax inhibitor family protein
VAEQQAELDGMPEPGVLRRVVCAVRCVVSAGRSVVYDFDVEDTGMRNLAPKGSCAGSVGMIR